MLAEIGASNVSGAWYNSERTGDLSVKRGKFREKSLQKTFFLSCYQIVKEEFADLCRR